MNISAFSTISFIFAWKNNVFILIIIIAIVDIAVLLLSVQIKMFIFKISNHLTVK